MIALLIICVVVFAVYCLIMLVLSLSLCGSKQQISVKEAFSIIIAARNEEDYIESTLKALKNQSVRAQSIIVVDDQSEDNTLALAMEFSKRNPEMQISVLKSDGQGKKDAWKTAISVADTELIMSLDADCTVGDTWAETMLFSKTSTARMISAPVLYAEKLSFLQKLFSAELLFLVSGGAAAACLHLPVQVSGAGLLFCKKDFFDFYNSDYGKNHQHGDDVFFMQFLIHQYGRKSMAFSNNVSSLVRTDAPRTISAFLKQRLRWASKAVSYRSILPFIFAFFLILSNALFLLAAPCFFIYKDPIFLYLAAAKLLADIILPAVAAYRWKYKFSGIAQLVLAIIYPFYLLWMGILLVFSKKSSWKGRS